MRFESPSRSKVVACCAFLLDALIVAALVVIFGAIACSIAFAQDSKEKTPPSPMDLPVAPVKFGDPPVEKTPESKSHVTGPTGEESGEDPNDTPPPVFFGEELNAEESDSIMYVLDQSGSMSRGKSNYEAPDGTLLRGTRWDRLLAEMTRSLGGLAETFHFGIVTYECRIEPWRGGKLYPATPENKAAALAFLAGIQPWGPTATGPAVSFALKKKASLYVLLTDGFPNCGLKVPKGAPWKAHLKVHRAHIAEANKLERIPINVFGIQAGTFRSFCQGVASDSGGSYFDVP